VFYLDLAFLLHLVGVRGMQLIDVFSDRSFINVVVWVLVHLNLNVKIKSLSHLQRQDRTQKTEQHGQEYKLHFVPWV
jgi:hypothetical protein